MVPLCTIHLHNLTGTYTYSRTATPLQNGCYSTSYMSTGLVSSWFDYRGLLLNTNAIAMPFLYKIKGCSPSRCSMIFFFTAPAAIWKQNRITRISTIESGFEFPFMDDSLVLQEDISGDEKKVLLSGDWNQPEWKENDGDGVGEGGGEGVEEEGEGQRKAFRPRRPGFSGPRR